MPLVAPGSLTGLYYILIAGLPWKCSWQMLKDFAKAHPDGSSILVDRVEVYQNATGPATDGWIRIKGQTDFERALADGRNAVEWVQLRDQTIAGYSVRTYLHWHHRIKKASVDASVVSSALNNSPGSEPSEEWSYYTAQSNATNCLLVSSIVRQPLPPPSSPVMWASYDYTVSRRSPTIVFARNRKPPRNSVYIPSPETIYIQATPPAPPPPPPPSPLVHQHLHQHQNHQNHQNHHPRSPRSVSQYQNQPPPNLAISSAPWNELATTFPASHPEIQFSAPSPTPPPPSLPCSPTDPRTHPTIVGELIIPAQHQGPRCQTPQVANGSGGGHGSTLHCVST